MQSDEHLLTVCRYVKRNALSAGLVARAEQWRWGSLWARLHGEAPLQALVPCFQFDQVDSPIQAI